MSKDNIKNNESFDKMAESLGTSYESTAEDLDKQLEQITETKKEVMKIQNGSLSLDDMEFMEEQIKNTIDSLDDVLDKLSMEIKVGAKSSMFEVFATLTNSKLAAIRELRELRKITFDANIRINEKSPGPKNLTVNMQLTSTQMRDMFKKAKQDSTLTAIIPEFRIDDGKNSKESYTSE